MSYCLPVYPRNYSIVQPLQPLLASGRRRCGLHVLPAPDSCVQSFRGGSQWGPPNFPTGVAEALLPFRSGGGSRLLVLPCNSLPRCHTHDLYVFLVHFFCYSIAPAIWGCTLVTQTTAGVLTQGTSSGIVYSVWGKLAGTKELIPIVVIGSRRCRSNLGSQLFSRYSHEAITAVALLWFSHSPACQWSLLGGAWQRVHLASLHRPPCRQVGFGGRCWTSQWVLPFFEVFCSRLLWAVHHVFPCQRLGHSSAGGVRAALVQATCFRLLL